MTAGKSPAKLRSSVKKSPRKSTGGSTIVPGQASMVGAINTNITYEVGPNTISPSSKARVSPARTSPARESKTYNLGISGEGANIFRNEEYENKIANI